MANNGIKITAPVSMTDIATVLGDSTDMAQSENVNIWSKNKPFEPHENLFIVQDDAARRKAAYGFYWWNWVYEAEAPFADNATTLLNLAIANSGKWLRKEITVSRMGDFDGYNHQAKRPYRYDATTPNLGATYYLRPVHDYTDPNVEIVMSDMPDFTGDWSISVADMHIVVIYRMKGSSSSATSVWTGFTIADLDNGLIGSATSINLPALNGLARREYDCIFAATNLPDSESMEDIDGNTPVFFYLPESLLTLVRKEGLSWSWGNVFNGETFRGMLLEDSNYNYIFDATAWVNRVYMALVIKNEFDQDLDWQISIKVWDGSNDSISDATEVFRATSSEWSRILESGQTINFEDTSEIQFDLVDVGGSWAAGNLRMAVNFDYKYQSASQWTQRHFNLLSGAVEQYHATDGYTLYDIIQTIPDYGQPIIF